jgi:glycosyltransferase involved in cell wall biosynthesis
MTVRFLLLGQLKFFKNEGYEIYVVCSPGRWIRDIEKEGIKVKTIDFKRTISPISDLATLFRLYLYFKKEKFDIIHTFTPKPGLLGQLSAKLAGVPIILNTIFGFYFHERNPHLKRRFFILIEKIAARFSDLIFFRNKEDFETALKEKIGRADLMQYVGDGIDISRFNPERFSEDFIRRKKEILGIEPQKKVIGIVGRLVREKGYLDLFEAFKKVLKEFPNTILLVVGPLEPEKKDRVDPNIIKNFDIDKNVLFLGERTDTDEIYSLMDMFVLPSYREGLPHSVLEASAMGKPVIATNIRGCREAVEDGKTGILIPLKNPEKLAETIIYLLENPEKGKNMGFEGIKKVNKEFDERLIFDRIKREYQRLIQEKL